MKATPMQRYALRLLFAARKECAIRGDRWTVLQQDEAERLMAPFGGQQEILRKIQLPVKPSPPRTLFSKNNSDAPVRTGRRRGNGIELGE